MKATVKKAFADKNDLSKTYAKGDTFEGTAERIRELAGYVTPDEPKRKEK